MFIWTRQWIFWPWFIGCLKRSPGRGGPQRLLQQQGRWRLCGEAQGSALLCTEGMETRPLEMQESVLPQSDHLRKCSKPHHTHIHIKLEPLSNFSTIQNVRTCKLSRHLKVCFIQNIRKVKCGVKWKYQMAVRALMIHACARGEKGSIRRSVCVCCENATVWPYTYMGPVLWSVPLELGGYLWGLVCPSAYSLPSSCWL